MNKLTGLDFWDACRIVSDKERMLRYDGGEWCLNTVGHVFNRSPRGLLVVESDKHWWPTVQQQREKNWEVEEEKPEELYIEIVINKSGYAGYRFSFENVFNGFLNQKKVLKYLEPGKHRFKLVPFEKGEKDE